LTPLFDRKPFIGFESGPIALSEFDWSSVNELVLGELATPLKASLNQNSIASKVKKVANV
jgi:hypothetical protein